MITIDPTTSLAELVVKRSSSARNVDSLGLDYCCRGSQSLVAACLEVGVDLDEVIARIVDAAPVEAPADCRKRLRASTAAVDKENSVLFPVVIAEEHGRSVS